MNAIEKLIDAVKVVLLDAWYTDKEGDEIDMLNIALREYESTPKPWAPPWALKIPEWEEVWFAVEKSGSGNFYNSEPFLGDELHEWISMGGTRLAECGLFEIPPGADWRTMKARVR